MGFRGPHSTKMLEKGLEKAPEGLFACSLPGLIQENCLFLWYFNSRFRADLLKLPRLVHVSDPETKTSEFE